MSPSYFNGETLANYYSDFNSFSSSFENDKESTDLLLSVSLLEMIRFDVTTKLF